MNKVFLSDKDRKLDVIGKKKISKLSIAITIAMLAVIVLFAIL